MKNSWQLIISISFIILIAGCTTKTICVIDQQEFSVMYHHLAPLLWNKNIVDSNGYYQEQINKRLPPKIGDYLFQHLPVNLTSSTTKTNILTFAQSQNPYTKITITHYGFSFQDNKRKIQIKLIAQTDWFNKGNNDWIVLYHVHSPNISTNYYLILPHPKENLPIDPQLVAICDELNNTCTIINDASTNTQNFGTSYFEVEPEIYSIISSPKKESIQENKETTVTINQLQK